MLAVVVVVFSLEVSPASVSVFASLISVLAVVVGGAVVVGLGDELALGSRRIQNCPV